MKEKLSPLELLSSVHRSKTEASANFIVRWGLSRSIITEHITGAAATAHLFQQDAATQHRHGAEITGVNYFGNDVAKLRSYGHFFEPGYSAESCDFQIRRIIALEPYSKTTDQSTKTLSI